MRLGPPEYFALMVLAFTTVSAVLGQLDPARPIELGAGLALGMIGTDSVSGQERHTLRLPELADGIEVVLVAVGLFAVGGALHTLVFERPDEGSCNRMTLLWMTRTEWKRSLPAWLRGTFIGFPFGSLPVGGAKIPTFISTLQKSA